MVLLLVCPKPCCWLLVSSVLAQTGSIDPSCEALSLAHVWWNFCRSSIFYNNRPQNKYYTYRYPMLAPFSVRDVTCRQVVVACRGARTNEQARNRRGWVECWLYVGTIFSFVVNNTVPICIMYGRLPQHLPLSSPRQFRAALPRWTTGFDPGGTKPNAETGL